MRAPDIIVAGKSNGEGMILHYETLKGTAVYGMGIPNIYSDTDWDLGPTWCYIVVGQKISLIDTGQIGRQEIFKNMMHSIDMDLADIDRVVITHCHEDHDGNLAEILSFSGAELWAHEIYRPMISYYPTIDNGAMHPELPGSCRLCFMPEKIYQDCLSYHQRRSSLRVDFAIHGDTRIDDENWVFLHTPGHTADSICLVLEDEVIFTGDTLLPDITPHPSLALAFEVNAEILPEAYRRQNDIYGLMNYLKSLSRLAALPSTLPLGTFPAHRLFYNGKFNLIPGLAGRAKEIMQFHMARCQSILDIVAARPCTMEEIAFQHFPAPLLKGVGKAMARNEISAHVELLEETGDVCGVGEDKQRVRATGTSQFLRRIEALAFP